MFVHDTHVPEPHHSAWIVVKEEKIAIIAENKRYGCISKNGFTASTVEYLRFVRS
jgi:hypothetical protein